MPSLIAAGLAVIAGLCSLARFNIGLCKLAQTALDALQRASPTK